MQRVTITLDDALMEALDAAMTRSGHTNRSEAIRDLVRAGLRSDDADDSTETAAALVYTYDHEKRELARRLTHAFHDHHALAVATMHVHLDPQRCLEVTVLRGKLGELRHLAEHVTAEKRRARWQLVVLP